MLSSSVMQSATLRSPLRIAVIGGGIGGLCAALSIHHHCGSLVDIDVYEQAPQYREIGAGVGIGVNAAALLYEIGVGDAAAKIAGKRHRDWITFRKFDDGTDVVTVPAIDKEEIKQLPVHRAEFLDLLVEIVNERQAAKLHVNKRCVRLQEEGDKIAIEFSDGTTAIASIVIGSDGIHSAVRGQFAIDRPQYSGQIAYRGLVPISTIEDWWGFDHYSVTWLGKDRHFLCFPISANKTLNIVAFVAEKEKNIGDLKESWTAVGRRGDVFKAFEGFEERVQKLIYLMPDQPSKWMINDRNPLDQWVYFGGKVILLGDAAHAMTPHQGAGAGQAIEDGYILGRALRDCISQWSSGNESGNREWREWAQIYQDVRLPRAQRVARTSKEAVEIYQGRVGDMKDMPFGQCVPEIHERVINRMRWVWTDDINAEYDVAVKKRWGTGIS